MNSIPEDSDSGWGVILPAAGHSVRFGGSTGKLLSGLDGQTVIQRSIAAFLLRPDVQWIGVAVRRDDLELRCAIESLNDPRLHVCPGGDSRADSVRRALLQSPDSLRWIGVHDAARPLVSQALIDRVLEAARRHGAAGPALPMVATVKQTADPLPAPVRATLPRDRLWALQTPQIMRRADLIDAYERCPIPLDRVTDDLQLLELVGRSCWLVEGNEQNLKITTQIDLKLAHLWLDPALQPFAHQDAQFHRNESHGDAAQ